MDKLRIFLSKLKTSFSDLPGPQKMLAVGSVLLLVGSLAYLAFTFNRVEYAPLYSDLSETDLASVVNVLKEKKIPYKLTGAHAVAVARDRLYETRLELAAEGLPRGSGVGFEIFDQQRLGSTEFVQRVNYQRALQGELARTINQMTEIQESRVHLVLPEESLFAEDQKKPRAAVLVKLRPGARLGQRQLQAIANLVSSAVEGLDTENVTIMSTDGKVYYKKDRNESPLEMSAYQLEVKKRMEEDLRHKVQNMLARVVGADKVVTQVSVDLDFSRVQIAEETYDPDSAAVRSQQKTLETSQGKAITARGNPDAPINLESRLLEKQPNGQSKTFNRQKETVNYELSRVTRQMVRSPGSVRKISVAVVVDGPYRTETSANGKTERVFVGRSPQELKTLEDLVKKAVGFDDGRGDQVTITNVAFAADPSMGQEAPAPENKYLAMLRRHQKILFNLLLLLLVFLFVVRPFMKRFQQIGQSEPSAEAPHPALPEGEEEELLEGPKEVRLKEQAVQLVLTNPSQASQVIRAWIKEDA
ncbi:flagellar M-ring protein FliF [Desulfacinum hydrothermale DSM 13146]|uniref:Flagellar M-ring protein n=1 Tax=Desulfacinum hydrothermale DSM 13146 TaxID=1121390 RepID=A0A1W1X5K8_9BACT|nr:flagellar basal-body MS-ring/collar protein FliF [Desulfacinum hydrothermale]SMC19224.1 flagellar M-ring protein FliF [Desulfacinum hydrothermale DSM 13146]